MARFDKFNNERNGTSEPAEPAPTTHKHATNGTKHKTADTSEEGSASPSKKRSPGDESELSELEASLPKKKQRKSKTVEDEDAAYAAKLQAELNAASRQRATRGANTKKRAPAPKKKKPKMKSSNTVKDEDDSDIGSGSGAEKKEVKRTGGFHVRAIATSIPVITMLKLPQKPMTLSEPLSQLLGETTVSSPCFATLIHLCNEPPL